MMAKKYHVFDVDREKIYDWLRSILVDVILGEKIYKKFMKVRGGVVDIPGHIMRERTIEEIRLKQRVLINETTCLVELLPDLKFREDDVLTAVYDIITSSNPDMPVSINFYVAVFFHNFTMMIVSGSISYYKKGLFFPTDIINIICLADILKPILDDASLFPQERLWFDSLIGVEDFARKMNMQYNMSKIREETYYECQDKIEEAIKSKEKLIFDPNKFLRKGTVQSTFAFLAKNLVDDFADIFDFLFKKGFETNGLQYKDVVRTYIDPYIMNVYVDYLLPWGILYKTSVVSSEYYIDEIDVINGKIWIRHKYNPDLTERLILNPDPDYVLEAIRRAISRLVDFWYPFLMDDYNLKMLYAAYRYLRDITKIFGEYA